MGLAYDREFALDCLVSPSPEALEKIMRTKRLVMANRDLSEAEAALDYRTYSLIIGRPKWTRAHTFERSPSRISSAGTLKAVVLLVDFADNQATESAAHYSDMLFSSGTYPTGSLRDFFDECSYGNLSVVGDVYGWYRMPNNYPYYVDNQNGFGIYPKNVQGLVEDAVNAADADVDFSQYDSDNDGYVDAIFVVHAGRGAEETLNTADIWSHRSSLSSPVTVDGVKVEDYTMEAEDGRMGIYSHELVHVFNIPDLYDTDYSSEGLGYWCLMASGSWNGGADSADTPAHPSVWVKKKLGWLGPSWPRIGTQKWYAHTLQSATEGAWAYGLSRTPVLGNEYFLAENRRLTGFDSALPGEGLLIYHVDDNRNTNSNENHPLVRLVQADGNRDLENAVNRGDAGDPFPGTSNNRVFNPDYYDGSNSGIYMKNISDPGPSMTFSLKQRESIKW